MFICYSAQDGDNDTDLYPSSGTLMIRAFKSVHVVTGPPHPAHVTEFDINSRNPAFCGFRQIAGHYYNATSLSLMSVPINLKSYGRRQTWKNV